MAPAAAVCRPFSRSQRRKPSTARWGEDDQQPDRDAGQVGPQQVASINRLGSGSSSITVTAASSVGFSIAVSASTKSPTGLHLYGSVSEGG